MTTDSTSPSSGEDGSGVDQGGDAPPVGGPEHHLLGPHRLPGDQGLGQGQLPQGDLPPVGPPVGQHLQKLLRRPARLAQAADDPPGLPVDGADAAGAGVEDQHAHGRGVHQGLQVGPSPLLLPVAAGVGDDQGRLGGEHHQGLLVLGGELDLLLAHVDVSDALSPVTERRGQEGQGRAHRHRRLEFRQAQLPDVAVEVPQPQRFADAAELLEEEHPVGKFGELPGLLGSQPGIEEFLYPPPIVQEGDDPVAGAGQRPGAVQDPLEHRLEVQALVDAQAGLAEAGQPLPQGVVFQGQIPGVTHSYDLRSGLYGPRSPGPPGLRKECISFGKITQGKLAENWSDIGVLSDRLSTDFTQHSVSHCPVTYPDLRWGGAQLAFDRLIDGVDIAAAHGRCLSDPGHSRPPVDGFSNWPPERWQ